MQGRIPVATYPPMGSGKFTTSLFGCCSIGCCSCLCKFAYLTLCKPCFFGGIYAKIGMPCLLGACCGSLVETRTMVRQHYGIAQDCDVDFGCGGDCAAAVFCTNCVALQLDHHLHKMAEEGAPMNGSPK